MTVHGRWNYLRFAVLIQYSLYKNLCVCSALMAFQAMNAYSGTPPFDSWLLLFFNMFFTFSGPFLYGLMEKDLDEAMIEKYPKAYRHVQQGRYFNVRTVLGWCASAFWHSFVGFGLTFYYMSENSLNGQGQMGGLTTSGSQSITLIVCICNAKLAFESQ